MQIERRDPSRAHVRYLCSAANAKWRLFIHDLIDY
jgi:hypothetical protein